MACDNGAIAALHKGQNERLMFLRSSTRWRGFVGLCSNSGFRCL